MLAYSSIAHAGYILVGARRAAAPRGGSAALFYLLVYSFMNLGAFGVVARARRGAASPTRQLDDYAGLGFRRPLLGVAMTIFMLSLTGIPPLAGFAGKLYVFTAAIREGYYVLAVIGVLNSAISAGYYIRVLIAMYMRDPASPETAMDPAPLLIVCLLVATVGTIYFGIFPDAPLDFARQSFLALR